MCAPSFTFIPFPNVDLLSTQPPQVEDHLQVLLDVVQGAHHCVGDVAEPTGEIVGQEVTIQTTEGGVTVRVRFI